MRTIKTYFEGARFYNALTGSWLKQAADKTCSRFLRLIRDCPNLQMTLLLVVRALPGLVGVVELHFVDDGKGVRSQVFLKDDSIIADHERHHARNAILGRNGDQCETADHRSLDHVV